MVNRACNGCLARVSTYTVPSACSLRTSVMERPRTWSTRCQCDALSVMIRRLDLRSVSSSTAAAETRVIHYIAQWQSLCCLGLAVFGCRVGDWNLLKAILVWALLFQLLKMANCWMCFVLFQWNITHVHCYSTTMTVIQHTVQIRVIKKHVLWQIKQLIKKCLEIR